MKIEINFSKEPLSIEDMVNLSKQFDKIPDDEMLALVLELTRVMQKRMEYLYDESEPTDIDEEQTQEMYYAKHQELYEAAKKKINEQAKELLRNNLRWGFEDDECLFEHLNIGLP